jgi:quercetin dioxygenase-like cupin family protein
MESPPSAVILRPGEGETFEARGSVMTFKALARTTAGRFSLMDRTLPPAGRMPPAHRHVDCEEAFLVLEGEVTFVVDGGEHTEGPGTFVLIPGGTGHTFGNRSEAPSRLLVLHAPAMDAYFAELERLWAGPTPPSVDEERALMGRHGMEPARPGPGVGAARVRHGRGREEGGVTWQ